MRGPIYKDRRAGGRALAEYLQDYRGRDDVIVLGLPRGGVPVAHEVARALDVALDVLVVRKLGVPGREELAMGAIASGGARYVNRRLVRELDIGEAELARVEAREREELARRERTFRGAAEPPDVRGRVVIVVDDGLATGATMRAAVEALRHLEPAALVVAVPLAPADTAEELAGRVERMVCPATPEPFMGVGQWYEQFEQTTDDEVRALLAERHRDGPATAVGAS